MLAIPDTVSSVVVRRKTTLARVVEMAIHAENLC